MLLLFFQLAHCLPDVASFTTAQPLYPNTAACRNASRQGGLSTAAHPQQQQPPRPRPSPESRRGEPGGPAALRALFVHIATVTCRVRPSRASPSPPRTPDPVPPAERWEPFKMAAPPPPALAAPHRALPARPPPPHAAAGPPPGVVQPQRPAGPGCPPREAPSISGRRSQFPAGGAATPRPAREGAATTRHLRGGSPPGGPKAKGKKGVNPEVHPPHRRPHRTARSAAQLFLRPRRSRPPPSSRAGAAEAGG